MSIVGLQKKKKKIKSFLFVENFQITTGIVQSLIILDLPKIMIITLQKNDVVNNFFSWKKKKKKTLKILRRNLFIKPM